MGLVSGNYYIYCNIFLCICDFYLMLSYKISNLLQQPLKGAVEKELGYKCKSRILEISQLLLSYFRERQIVV